MSNRSEALPTQLESIKYLSELALELRVSWDHSTDDIWRKLDPDLWSLTRNPTLVLHATAETKLRELAGETEFRHRIEDFVLARRQYSHSPGWYQFAHQGAPLTHVAYFSMECTSSEPIGQVGTGIKRGSGPSELNLWLRTNDAAGVWLRWFSVWHFSSVTESRDLGRSRRRPGSGC